MSSPRSPMHTDGVIVHEGRPVGPLRLPLKSTDTFVEEFNDRYQSVGLQINLAQGSDARQRTTLLLWRDAGDSPTVGTASVDDPIM